MNFIQSKFLFQKPDIIRIFVQNPVLIRILIFKTSLNFNFGFRISENQVKNLRQIRIQKPDRSYYLSAFQPH